MKIELITHTQLPAGTVTKAASVCYSDRHLHDISQDIDHSLLHHLKTMNHESVFEHATFTFAITGISRSCLAQLTRHRIASFSVRSQRYVTEDSFKYVIPKSIANDPIALKEYLYLITEIKDVYSYLIKKHGIPKEDARYILPNATETQLIMTINARSLFNFFNLRLCNRAQWEIRELAEEMYGLVSFKAPELFRGVGPDCVTGGCKQGKKSCKKGKEMKERYA